jgi:hypothetical protein
MLVRRLLDITCHQNAGKNHDKKYPVNPLKAWECQIFVKSGTED